MIDWEHLYKILLETKSSDFGERHHILPKHDGGFDEDGIVVLERRYHTLAHYIRYRWLGQAGDRVAYRMMLGQQLNPMHDPEIKEKHAILMGTEEQRAKYRGPKSLSHRNSMSDSRMQYIESLSDEEKKEALIKLHDPKHNEKKVEGIKNWINNNYDLFLERQYKRNKEIKKSNKNKTKEELKVIYGRPKESNGTWKGYVVLERDYTKEVFTTMKEASDFIKCSVSHIYTSIKRGYVTLNGKPIYSIYQTKKI